MNDIQFSKEEIAVIVKKIQEYFSKELDNEIGQFDAEFLLEFFTREIGGYFYNRGVYDAQAILSQRMDDISEAIFALEKFTDYER